MQDEEIIFKRFPEDKQDQIKSLVEYAILMGLTGNDLVSIGGKLERAKGQNKRRRNLELIKKLDVKPVNKEISIDQRFILTLETGVYEFEYKGTPTFGWDEMWDIRSQTTSKIIGYKSNRFEHVIGKPHKYTARRYRVLLDVINGHCKLDF